MRTTRAGLVPPHSIWPQGDMLTCATQWWRPESGVKGMGAVPVHGDIRRWHRHSRGGRHSELQSRCGAGSDGAGRAASGAGSAAAAGLGRSWSGRPRDARSRTAQRRVRQLVSPGSRPMTLTQRVSPKAPLAQGLGEALLNRADQPWVHAEERGVQGQVVQCDPVQAAPGPGLVLLLRSDRRPTRQWTWRSPPGRRGSRPMAASTSRTDRPRTTAETR